MLEGLGGYTPIIGGRPDYQLDGTVGKRFLQGGKLGIIFTASYDYHGRGINDIEPGPALKGPTTFATTGTIAIVAASRARLTTA